MKMKQLKAKVKRIWEKLHTQQDGVVIAPQSFETTVKRMGDRRYKKTWIKALARFQADWLHETCLDAWSLVAYSFNFTPDRWDYEYRHEIFDEFLMHPEGLELVRAGLEQLFSADFKPKEKEKANGFFRLLEQRGTRGGATSISAVLNRRIRGASTTT